MIDPTRPELHECRLARHDEQHGKRSGDGARPQLDVSCHDQRQSEQQDRGPNDACFQFCTVDTEERSHGNDAGRERQVDHARPMRKKGLGRTDARECRIEPWGAGEEIAHANEAGRIVAVTEVLDEGARPLAQLRKQNVGSRKHTPRRRMGSKPQRCVGVPTDKVVR